MIHRLLKLILMILAATGSVLGQTEIKRFSIGFFEGGPYPFHTELRQEFRQQLTGLLPDGYSVSYPPQAFKSAAWNRDTSRIMAAELSRDTSVDLVVAVGPWTVEDLLAAGFDRPIVAVFRSDLMLEGLLDSSGISIVDNLTVRSCPRKLKADLYTVSRLVPSGKIGLLFFPADQEFDVIAERVMAVGDSVGLEVVVAEGYDYEGTYAFFVAAASLQQKVDAFYVPVLWGFDTAKIRRFCTNAVSDSTPFFSGEGYYNVSHGALAGLNGETARAVALFHAWKTVRIMQGAVPADLPNKIDIPATPIFNQQVARELGVSLPDELWIQAGIVHAPPPTDVERFTLIEAVNVALSNHPGYLSRYDALEAAAQAVAQTKSAYLPQVRAYGSVTHLDDNAVHNDDRFEADQSRVAISLEQEIFSLGRIRDIQLAARNRDLSEVDRRQAALDLELGVAKAYLNHLQARAELTIMEVCLREIERCLQVATVRDKISEGDVADVFRWQNERLRTIRAVTKAESRLNITRIQFNTLLGRPGDIEFALDVQSFTDERLNVTFYQLEQLGDSVSGIVPMAEALAVGTVRSHPQIAQTDVAIDIQQVRLAQNTSRYLPRIGFQTKLGWADERQATSGFNENNPTWSVRVQLGLPLFLGGGRFKERARLNAELSELSNEKDNAVLIVTSRVSSDLEQLTALGNNYLLTAHSIELAGEYTDRISLQYATGNRNIVELLEAIDNDRKASMEAITNQFEFFRMVSKLVHDVGWSPQENGHTPSEELMSQLTGLLSRRE